MQETLAVACRMGIFGFLKSTPDGALKKHAARVANKRSQAQDRWESIQALTKMGTPESIGALLKRFTFRVDPSITDQEEKDAVFQSIVASGETAVQPILAFLQSSESISWPLKMLGKLVGSEEVERALLDLLSTMDTEYERDPQKKIQVLSALEDHVSTQVFDAVRPFLEDVNETTRFHAVGALVAQNQEEGAQALSELLLREESVRVRARILDGFIERNWKLPGPRAELLEKLPTGYALDSSGNPRRT